MTDDDISRGEEKADEEAWRSFLRDHLFVAILFVVGAVAAVIGAVLVFLWFTDRAQNTGLVPSVMGEWSLRNLIDFLLNLAFWELLLIGIPVAVGAIAGYMWWKRLPLDERQRYRFGRRSRSQAGGNAFSILVFLAFCLKIFLDGNWDVPISTWTLDYVVDSLLTVVLWLVVIFAIPAGIGLIWWITRGSKRSKAG
jgi:hypothetical protein